MATDPAAGEIRQELKKLDQRRDNLTSYLKAQRDLQATQSDAEEIQ